MNKLKYIFVFALCALFFVPKIKAQQIECVGTATAVTNNNDSIFIFAGEPHLKSKVGKVDWYRTSDGALLQSDIDEIYPETGEGVIVKKTGVVLGVYYVFDMTKYTPKIDTVLVTPRCRETIVQLVGNIPPMTYTDTFGLPSTLIRHCAVAYNNLSWGKDSWQDSAAVETNVLSLNKMHLPAVYGTTSFAVRFDDEWCAELALPLDSAVSEEIEPVAVKSHVVSTTTVRGKKGEKSNEVERPTESTTLSGSAPLDIYFETNPTPAVEFYDWCIYRSSELIATRFEEIVRYIFSSPGHYCVVNYVLNQKCPCKDTDDGDCEKDSTVIEITVPESQLLVPNVFTPNGDGSNDEFRVLYRSLREYHIWVYNRWGKLVYESTDPSKGWDGMIGGRPAAEGAYYYVIRAMGTDAAQDAEYHSRQAYDKAMKNSDESYLGIYQMSGDINLLRGKDK